MLCSLKLPVQGKCGTQSQTRHSKFSNAYRSFSRDVHPLPQCCQIFSFCYFVTTFFVRLAKKCIIQVDSNVHYSSCYENACSLQCTVLLANIQVIKTISSESRDHEGLCKLIQFLKVRSGRLDLPESGTLLEIGIEK